MARPKIDYKEEYFSAHDLLTEIRIISEKLAYRKMSVYSSTSEMLKANHDGIVKIYRMVEDFFER